MNLESLGTHSVLGAQTMHLRLLIVEKKGLAGKERVWPSPATPSSVAFGKRLPLGRPEQLTNSPTRCL